MGTPLAELSEGSRNDIKPVPKSYLECSENTVQAKVHSFFFSFCFSLLDLKIGTAFL